MDQARVLCLIGPEDAERRALEEAVDALDPRAFDAPDQALNGLDAGTPALLVATRAAPCGSLLELARAITRDDRDWLLLRAEDDGDGGTGFRPLSAGFAVDAGRIAAAVSGDDEDAGPLFDLLAVLRGVARVRHDINNPLTAGLAETQLLLMDVEEEGELRDSLETIQRQLRRIQELVETLTELRRPSRKAG